MSDDSNNDKVTFIQVMTSVLAAMFGVSTEKNRERDFKKGKLWHYIVGGLLFAAIFIAVLIFVVNMALSDI